MIFRKKEDQDDIILLLGPGCSDVSSSVAEVANYWNLTVVGILFKRLFKNSYLIFYFYSSFHLDQALQRYRIENDLEHFFVLIRQQYSTIRLV
jgi:hypothetical protein